MILLELQKVDSAIDSAKHKANSLPEHEQIAKITEEIVELEGQKVEADTLVSDLAAAQRKADADVETVRARQTRDRERLNSGAITNPKDLESLQHEIEALQRRISTLEDEELEVMEQLENAQQAVAEIDEQLSAKRLSLLELEKTRDAALAELNSAIELATAERQSVASQVDEKLLALYEKLRAQHGGVGAAALNDGTCEGCHLKIDVVELKELLAKPLDSTLRCPECSRILVRQ